MTPPASCFNDPSSQQPSEKPLIPQTSPRLPRPIQPYPADSPTKVSLPRAASVSQGLTPHPAHQWCHQGSLPALDFSLAPLKPNASRRSKNNLSQLSVSSFLHLLGEFGEHLLCVRHGMKEPRSTSPDEGNKDRMEQEGRTGLLLALTSGEIQIPGAASSPIPAPPAPAPHCQDLLDSPFPLHLANFPSSSGPWEMSLPPGHLPALNLG